jgi:hypothetical protein
VERPARDAKHPLLRRPVSETAPKKGRIASRALRTDLFNPAPEVLRRYTGATDPGRKVGRTGFLRPPVRAFARPPEGPGSGPAGDSHASVTPHEPRLRAAIRTSDNGELAASPLPGLSAMIRARWKWGIEFHQKFTVVNALSMADQCARN